MFSGTFVLSLIFNVLVESFHEDLGKTWDLEPMSFPPCLKICVDHTNFPLTLI